MESNWRLALFDVGISGQNISPFEPESYYELCGRLITPMHVGGFEIRWVCKKVVNYGAPRGVLMACVPGTDQGGQTFGAYFGTFPYGFLVHPDT